MSNAHPGKPAKPQVYPDAFITFHHIPPRTLPTLKGMRRVLCLPVLLLCLCPLTAQQKQPFTVEAMLKLSRITEPVVSPDGKTIAFTVQTVDLEANTKPRQIYTVPTAGGVPPVKLTTEGSNFRPRWTPDGQRLAFLSTRGEGNIAQVWSMKPDGTEAHEILHISSPADGLLLSPDGKKLLITADRYPDCSDDACNKTRAEAEAKSKVKARSYTSLLYRHWTEFQGKTRRHLLIADIDGTNLKDLTPGNRDVPPFSLGGPDDYAFSPDTKEICYSSNADPDLALSTNSDLFLVPATGGEAKKITTNPGADASPVYSPDGKYIAYRSQARAGYESDLWRLNLYERATARQRLLADSIDRPVESVTWHPDSQRVFYTLEDRGRGSVNLIAIAGGGSKGILTGNAHFDDVQFTPDGKTLIYTSVSGSRPTELFTSQSGGAATALTHINDDVLEQYALTRLEETYVPSSDGARVHSFIVKPPNFQAGRKYPVLFLIHGGPEGAWGETWSYRWNPQVFANAGYLVVMPNPRGSTGYGQKFTEEIQGDWGGRAFDDIMAVVDYVAKQPYADADRFAAAGGSYGGYMVDWLLGHTDRFKALVSHAGVFDLRSMVGETEELWFPMWEFKGMPWNEPDLYAKWSPSYYVKDFKTPTLVLHGELDYRVPVGQGMQLFTALQLQKVPSKMVLFPDEGHWVLKPQNTALWYHTFQDWIDEWTRKPTMNR